MRQNQKFADITSFSDVEYVVRLLYQHCAHIFAPDKILQNLEQGDTSVFLLCFLLLGPKESLTRFPMNKL